MKYHSDLTSILTRFRETGFGKVSVGQFDWGGRLLNSNGGVRSLVQEVWKSSFEYNGINQVDCETNESSRYESRT